MNKQVTYRSRSPFTHENLWDFTIGFDSFFESFESLFEDQARNTFPPYNIEKIDNKYHITLGVSGYTENDLTVETKDGNLYILGDANSNTEEGEQSKTTFYRGLAGRKFKRVFSLAETVEVTNVTLGYGLLTIELMIPELEVEETTTHEINVLR